jgi:cysteine synthase B
MSPTAPAFSDTRKNVLELVGNTPLLRLERVAPHISPKVQIYAKAEWYNPGGSVKDRPVLWMLRDAEKRGVLHRDIRIADATSGNTGIAYATLGAALGYKVTLAMPANASAERKRILRALGAELLLTDAIEGIDGSINTIRELVAREPDHYFYPDQFNNPANPEAHYQTTGVEILEQTQNEVTHFVAAMGTSGTFMGTSRRLREAKADVQLIAVQPDGPYHALEGVKHMETTEYVPGIYDSSLPNAIEVVRSEDALAMVGTVARTEGLMIGVSAAANVAAAIRVAERLEQGVVVTILCDSAARYLSEPFWDTLNQ